VQPLEPPGQQRQLVLSKHVELLIWQRHQRRQRIHPGRCVSVRLNHSTTNESKTMGVNRALKTGCQTTINLSRLEFENSSFTVRVVYFSDSRMASTFPSHTLRSSV
jgi:hypothetical protein